MAVDELTGWLAALFTLLAFSMHAMVPLRLAALCANACFISYGMLNELYPVVALHLLLVPCNAIRLYQLLLARGFLPAATGLVRRSWEPGYAMEVWGGCRQAGFGQPTAGGQGRAPKTDWLLNESPLVLETRLHFPSSGRLSVGRWVSWA
jgi:hypothetical protein